MSDELRSALALSRAREQIHKAHLKEVQGENKRLKEQLKEEKILYQQTLKKLHGLQQAGTRNRSPKNSRRASTGGGRMLGKGLGSPGTTLADVFKNVGTQTKRVSNLLQPRRNVAEKKLNEQVGNLSRQLQQEQAAAADNQKRVKEVSRNLAMLMDAIKIFEKAVLSPVDSDGSLSPQPPTVRKITRDAQRERIKLSHQREREGGRDSARGNAGVVPNTADVENVVLSLGDLADEIALLRSKQMAEAETQLVEISGNAVPTRTEVLESKLRILQEVSAQKEQNHMEERQRLEAVSPTLHKYICSPNDLHGMSTTLTLNFFPSREPKDIERLNIELSDMRNGTF